MNAYLGTEDMGGMRLGLLIWGLRLVIQSPILQNGGATVSSFSSSELARGSAASKYKGLK